MGKVYRTARGKVLDMEKIRLKNEDVIAVGDFGGQIVNARGDIIGKNGEIVKSRNEVMADHYKVNTQIPQDKSSVKREAKPDEYVDTFDEDPTFEEEIEGLLSEQKGE